MTSPEDEEKQPASHKINHPLEWAANEAQWNKRHQSGFYGHQEKNDDEER